MITMYGDEDPIKARKEILQKMIAKDGEVEFSPKRTDMAAPDKLSKLRRYARTANKKFNSEEGETYQALRRDFWRTMKAQQIDLDLSFNYHSSTSFSDSGLKFKDGLGPYNFGKSKLPMNPFGLTIAQCEAEARLILEHMVFPGPVLQQIDKTAQRSRPILDVFDFFDRIFFKTSRLKLSNLRYEFHQLHFNNRRDRHQWNGIEGSQKDLSTARWLN